MNSGTLFDTLPQDLFFYLLIIGNIELEIRSINRYFHKRIIDCRNDTIFWRTKLQLLDLPVPDENPVLFYSIMVPSGISFSNEKEKAMFDGLQMARIFLTKTPSIVDAYFRHMGKQIFKLSLSSLPQSDLSYFLDFATKDDPNYFGKLTEDEFRSCLNLANEHKALILSGWERDYVNKYPQACIDVYTTFSQESIEKRLERFADGFKDGIVCLDLFKHLEKASKTVEERSFLPRLYLVPAISKLLEPWSNKGFNFFKPHFVDYLDAIPECHEHLYNLAKDRYFDLIPMNYTNIDQLRKYDSKICLDLVAMFQVVYKVRKATEEEKQRFFWILSTYPEEKLHLFLLDYEALAHYIYYDYKYSDDIFQSVISTISKVLPPGQSKKYKKCYKICVEIAPEDKDFINYASQLLNK